MVSDFFKNTIVHKREKYSSTAIDPNESVTIATIGNIQGYIQAKSGSVYFPARKVTEIETHLLVCGRGLDIQIDDILETDGKDYRVISLHDMTLTPKSFDRFNQYGLQFIGV